MLATNRYISHTDFGCCSTRRIQKGSKLTMQSSSKTFWLLRNARVLKSNASVKKKVNKAYQMLNRRKNHENQTSCDNKHIFSLQLLSFLSCLTPVIQHLRKDHAIQKRTTYIPQQNVDAINILKCCENSSTGPQEKTTACNQTQVPCALSAIVLGNLRKTACDRYRHIAQGKHVQNSHWKHR